MLELALVENIQRKDLTPFEEAEALHQPGAALRLHARGPGASAWGSRARSVTESLALHGMPPEVRKVCRLAGITNKSVLLQIVRQGDPQKMLALVEKIASQGGATREQVRKETQKPKAGRPKAFTFNFQPQNKAFNLRLSFNKKNASKDEIIAALENILEELQSQAKRRPQRADSEVRDGGIVERACPTCVVRGLTAAPCPSLVNITCIIRP